MKTTDAWKTNGLSYIITDKRVTVTLPDGQPISVSKADENFKNVIKAISDKNWEAIPDLVSPKIAIETKYGGTFTVKDDVVFIKNEEVPYSLSKRIIDFAKNNLPVEPLLRFWDNLSKNPSYRSVQQLYSFLENNDHPITSDGCFIAYRRVTNDFKDFYTKTMDNSIGTTVSMPRNKVNEDPEQTCSNGLHVANYDYACNHYNGGQGILVAVKVNPKDVVAIPVDYNESKMRVCEFVVLEEIKAEITNKPLYDVENYEDCENEDEEEHCYDDDDDYDDDD